MMPKYVVGLGRANTRLLKLLLKTKWDDFQYAYCMLLTIRVYLYKVLIYIYGNQFNNMKYKSTRAQQS
jgi:hypothetical protein